LGISLDQVKTVLQATQQFIFTDGTVNGQPASTATLGSGAAASFPAIANGFSAQFIGDPCNISQLTLSLPRNDQQNTVDQAIGLIDILIAAVLPSSAQFTVLTWMSQEYATIPVGGQAQTTAGSMHSSPLPAARPKWCWISSRHLNSGYQKKRAVRNGSPGYV
jgi:hypothetical protein